MDSAMEWQCADCLKTFPEKGNRGGYMGAMNHARRTGHTIRGLVDLDTGEILIQGLDQRAAMAAGVLQRPQKAKEEKAPADDPPPDDGRDANARKKKGGSTTDALDPSVTNNYTGQVTADIKGLDIHFPTYISAYAAMGMRVLADPDSGQPYVWSADGMSKFLTDFLTKTFERMVPTFLGLTYEQAQSAAVRQQIASFIQLVEGKQDPTEAATFAQSLYQTIGAETEGV